MENQNSRSVTNIVVGILIAFAIIFGSMYFYNEYQKRKRVEQAQKMLDNFMNK